MMGVDPEWCDLTFFFYLFRFTSVIVDGNVKENYVIRHLTPPLLLFRGSPFRIYRQNHTRSYIMLG